MHDRKATIEDFLNASAARQPTPGGGAVSALVGALAASMGEMAVNYSMGKKGQEFSEAELKPALNELTRARIMLLQLMVEDQAAYVALSEAYKQPKDTPEQKAKFAAALRAGIQVPQTIAATGLAVLGLCDQILNFINPKLLSDLAVCADLAMASIRCGAYNVRANLPSIVDHAERIRIESQLNEVLSRATELIRMLSPRIWARYGQVE